jgi:sugar phosphate isomerase/epimerase
MSRRDLLSTMGAAIVAGLPRTGADGRLQVCIFSKHLQWLDWNEMAGTAAELGFDGIDLTLRRGGHVEPERAEQDLPRVAEITRKAGLALPMVTAGIVDERTPHVETMLRAIHSVGVRRYRWGGFRYIEGKPIPERLNELRQDAARLGELNRKYDVCAMYHTHSGLEVGAPIWDLWVILKDLDPGVLGVNFDVAHATIEGGLGGWIASLGLVGPWIRGVAIKDFRWERNERGEWRPAWCPLGQGMVNFGRFFAKLKESNFSGPVQLHFEYPLGGADTGARKLTIDRSQVLAPMRRDLEMVRRWLREAGLA